MPSAHARHLEALSNVTESAPVGMLDIAAATKSLIDSALRQFSERPTRMAPCSSVCFLNAVSLARWDVSASYAAHCSNWSGDFPCGMALSGERGRHVGAASALMLCVHIKTRPCQPCGGFGWRRSRRKRTACTGMGSGHNSEHEEVHPDNLTDLGCVRRHHRGQDRPAIARGRRQAGNRRLLDREPGGLNRP